MSCATAGMLLDLTRFGDGPELAVADGALGFWKAVEEVWPKTRAKRALQEIWMAATKKDALAAFEPFIETWRVKYEKAVECLI
jgi:putative transposase